MDLQFLMKIENPRKWWWCWEGGGGGVLVKLPPRWGHEYFGCDNLLQHQPRGGFVSSGLVKTL